MTAGSILCSKSDEGNLKNLHNGKVEVVEGMEIVVIKE